MATLHVFIDESGKHYQGEHYTLAACWAVSTFDNNNTQNVFDPSKQRIMSSLETNTEIKGNQLLENEYQNVLSNFDAILYDDNSVMNDPSVWNNALPMRATFHDVQPSVAVSSLQNLLGEGREQKNCIHLLALVSVLDPIFSNKVQSAPEIENIRITLDGGIWGQVADSFKSGLESVGYSGPPIALSEEDSKKFPGIQFADLLAYPWRRYQMQGEYADVFPKITSYQFDDL